MEAEFLLNFYHLSEKGAFKIKFKKEYDMIDSFHTL